MSKSCESSALNDVDSAYGIEWTSKAKSDLASWTSKILIGFEVP